MGATMTCLVAGSILFIIPILYYSRPNRHRLSQEELFERMLIQLVSVLEQVVDRMVGHQYTQEDRYRIAIRMVEIITASNLSLEQIMSDPKQQEALTVQAIESMM